MTAAEILASLTDDQAEQLRLQLLAISARGDGPEAVFDFGELVFDVRPAKHHRAWIEQVMGNLRTGIVAPPESAKTTWITKITTAWWIGKHPLTTSGICSASDDAAQKMAAGIADTIESNPRWKLVFPDVVPDKQRGWSSAGYHVMDLAVDREKGAGEWARRRYGILDASLMAAGVGSSAWNGVRITGIFVGDDMHDRRSKTQQKTCDDTVDFFNDTALPRATKEARVVVVQTRWNPKDVIAKVKALPHFKVFEHPAILPDGTSYWPEHWSIEQLQARKVEIGEIVFELVYQGNDRAVEGQVLKAAWLHDFPFSQIQKAWNRYFGIDFAQRLREIEKKDDDPDHFALAVYADTGTRLVLEDVFDQELYMADAEELFFAKAQIFKPKATGLETNGAAAKKYWLNLLARMRLIGVNYVIIPITSAVDKGSRYALFAPYFSSAQVMVSDEPTPGLQTFRAQWVGFPRGHDDALDAAFNGWHVSSHLLPTQSIVEAAARQARQKTLISPAAIIDRAYR